MGEPPVFFSYQLNPELIMKGLKMLTGQQKNEIVKGAMDWALSNGFNYEQAIGYANEFLKVEMENPSFTSELTPFSL